MPTMCLKQMNLRYLQKMRTSHPQILIMPGLDSNVEHCATSGKSSICLHRSVCSMMFDTVTFPMSIYVVEVNRLRGALRGIFISLAGRPYPLFFLPTLIVMCTSCFFFAYEFLFILFPRLIS
ncbi:hypothetical protein AB6A40_011185 [Gnathostoma spinigerum]|uniref:Uncharacterized protein n=1 Tax=Gnathostoma spinigerum TaxID=75299 RepID=A0ABD6F2J4_9BILA